MACQSYRSYINLDCKEFEKVSGNFSARLDVLLEDLKRSPLIQNNNDKYNNTMDYYTQTIISVNQKKLVYYYDIIHQ